MIIDTFIQTIPCSVKLTFHEASSGGMDGCMQIEPDEPAGFDIDKIYKLGETKGHMQWLEDKMTDNDRDGIFQAAWESMQG